MKNELARDIIRAQEKIQYDTQCKKVLANKTILAWILKYTVEEFRDMEIPEIRDCIEGGTGNLQCEGGAGGDESCKDRSETRRI